VKDLCTGRIYHEADDALVLAPGATPARLPLPGIDLSGIFALRTIRTAEESARGSRRPPRGRRSSSGADSSDWKWPRIWSIANRIHVLLGDAVARFEGVDGRATSVVTRSGAAHAADMVILSIGVKPETTLACDAGLELGPRGGICVDESMRTSDHHIWAVGDAVEVHDFIAGEACVVPLAGPANRQGRIAADAICGKPERFRGVQATEVCGVFGLTVATTGIIEKRWSSPGMRTTIRCTCIRAVMPATVPALSQSTSSCFSASPTGWSWARRLLVWSGWSDASTSSLSQFRRAVPFLDLEEAELCSAPHNSARPRTL